MLTISGCSGWASSIFSTESPPPFSSVVSVMISVVSVFSVISVVFSSCCVDVGKL